MTCNPQKSRTISRSMDLFYWQYNVIIRVKRNAASGRKGGSMPTQEERLSALEKFQTSATHIRETEENTTILLGVIREQRRDIKRIFQRLEVVNERLDTIDGRLDTMENHMEKLEGQVGELGGRMAGLE